MSTGAGELRRTRVVVADDSPFVCRLLASYLEAGGCEVVGTAAHGRRAIELTRELSPDVLTLDLDMPGIDGLAALEQLMSAHPLPVVVISGVSGKGAARTLTALELGAVDFVLKYEPGRPVDPKALRAEIVAKVEAASRIRVVRSLPARKVLPMRPPARPAEGTVSDPAPRAKVSEILPPGGVPGTAPGGVIVIGASTGGPVALRQLLAALPADFGAAVLVVQHIPASFTPVLAAQLDRQVALEVREAAEGDRLLPGVVLVAPGGSHLVLRHDGRVMLKSGPEICGHRPSIDVTMQAVAQLYGSRATGVLLTGMGQDGAEGLVAIHSRGGRTLAQDAASCAVNGMPQRAVERGVVDFVAPPAELGRWLSAELVVRRRQRAC